MAAATFKVCRCCRTYHGLRRRVCRRCKVPAIWDAPTAEQVEGERARKAEVEETIRRLLADEPLVELATTATAL